MSKLLYTNDDDLMTHREIELLPLPEKRGRFHHPYSFGTYISDVKDALSLRGLDVVSEEFVLANDQQRLFGIMEVVVPGVEDSDWRLLVGLRGSHDSRIARGLVLGSQVMVCSNLCFSGNIGDLNTKQTTFIEDRMPELIRDAVNQIPSLADKQQQTYEAYKHHEIKPRIGDAALVELFRRKALTSHQLAIAITEWDNPAFDEHGEHGDTVWKLFNACTQALKPAKESPNHSVMVERSIKVSSFMDSIIEDKK